MEGQEARRRRLAAKKTQSEVASEIEVSVKTVRTWEKTHAPKLLQYYFDQIGA